jgi:hypothetical protein
MSACRQLLEEFGAREIQFETEALFRANGGECRLGPEAEV